ncbi:MAG: acyl-CoA thioesterase [Candidatus Spechtbacterales bacterium]
MKRKNRPVSATEIENYPAMIFPEDLNSQDKMFGGMLVATMDKLAGTLLFRHTGGQPFGTVYIDGISFLVPVYRGDLLLLDASINRVWNSSCEIGIRAKVQRRKTGEIQHLSSTYFTFVAVEELDEIDEKTGHQKIVAAPIKYGATPGTKEQKRRWLEAEERRRERLEKKSNRA